MSIVWTLETGVYDREYRKKTKSSQFTSKRTYRDGVVARSPGMASVSVSTLTATDEGGRGNISTVHQDIIRTHILTRLDGPALASVGCASSQLHVLCAEDELWRGVCVSMWPSVDDSVVRNAISSFPGGHRALFSDSFPLIDHSSQGKSPEHPFCSTEWISAVDIHYQGTLIFSKVQKSETETGWFLSSPFRVDLLDPKEVVPTLIHHARETEAWLKHLEDRLTLSWILIDPIRKRSVNLSSRRPVSVQRHWLTDDMELRYAVVMAGVEGTSELVQCKITVTCGGKEGGELHVKKVSMGLEDMEGRHVMGKESLMILLRAMENGKRRKCLEMDIKEKFEHFLQWKRHTIERKQRRETALDMFFLATGVTLFFSFWCFFL